MGWKTFETMPPEGELINVYCLDKATSDYWIITEKIVNGQFTIRAKNTFMNGGVACLWREMHPEPTRHMQKKGMAAAPNLPFAKDLF